MPGIAAGIAFENIKPPCFHIANNVDALQGDCGHGRGGAGGEGDDLGVIDHCMHVVVARVGGDWCTEQFLIGGVERRTRLVLTEEHTIERFAEQC